MCGRPLLSSRYQFRHKKQNKLTIFDDQDDKLEREILPGYSAAFVPPLVPGTRKGCHYISDYVHASTVSIAISVPKLEHEQVEQKLCNDKSAWKGKQRDFCKLKTGTEWIKQPGKIERRESKKRCNIATMKHDVAILQRHVSKMKRHATLRNLSIVSSHKLSMCLFLL